MTVIGICTAVDQVECQILHVIRFDFVEIIQHKGLIVWLEQFVRQESTHHVIHIDVAGLDQPVWTVELSIDKVEHEHEGTVAMYQQVAYKQFFVDTTDDLPCFYHRILIIELAIKHLLVKSKTTHRIVPDLFTELYGTILQTHQLPVSQSPAIDFKLALTIIAYFHAATHRHILQAQGLESSGIDHAGQGLYGAVVSRQIPIHITPEQGSVVVLYSDQLQVRLDQHIGLSHSIDGPTTIVFTVGFYQILIAYRYQI